MKRMNKGQASLVILLLMAVGMSLGLAISREVVTDIEISRKQEESTRAFSAAESGIEEALFRWQAGQPIPETVTLDTGEATIEAEELGKNQSSFLFPGSIEAGDYAVVWLADHTSTGEIDFSSDSGYQGGAVNLCWENGAALEAVLFYRDNSNLYRTERWAYDPNESRRGENHFAAPSGNCLDLGVGVTLDFPTEATPPGGKPLFLIVRLYYSSSRLGAVVEGDTLFPSQGQLVTSTGEVSSGEGEKVSRRLRVFQTWDLPPFVFLEPVFSSGSAQG